MVERVAASEISWNWEEPQNWIQGAVMMLTLWRASLLYIVFWTQPDNNSLSDMRVVPVEEKFGIGIPFVREDVFCPATKTHSPVLF